MLVDDQIEEKEASGALDEISRRINRKPSRDIVAGIKVAEKFQEDLQTALTNETKQQSTEKNSDKINPEDLLKGIREDMGEGR